MSLACERFVFGLEAIEAFIGFKIPVRPVTDELIADDASRGLRLGGLLRGGRGRDGERDRGRDRGRGERRPREDSRRPQRWQPAPPSAPQMPAPAPAAAPAARAAAAPPAAPAPAPDRNSDVEARLEYYRRKYGEHFEIKK